MTDGRHAVAERNRDAILAGAARVLAATPEAGVGEIATAAGVGRATVYRHWPSREALVAALAERARQEALEAVREADVDAGSVEEALRRLVAGLLGVGDRYRFLSALAGREPTLPRDKRAAFRPVGRMLERLVARGRREGAWRTDLPATWCARTLAMLISTGVLELDDERMTLEQATDAVVATALSALSRPGSDPPASSTRAGEGADAG